MIRHALETLAIAMLMPPAMALVYGYEWLTGKRWPLED